MHTVNIHEAKTHLSKLLDEIAQGQEVVIARAGKPIARLVPITRTRRKYRLGVLKGKINIPNDFDAPLPDDILREFEE